MIVTCPKCKSKFQLSFAMQREIRNNGNILKCGHCQHMWNKNDEPEVSNNEKAELATGQMQNSDSFLREVFANKIYNEERYFHESKNRKLKYIFTIILSSYIFLTLLINKNLILEKAPALAPIYALTGLYQTKGLEFSEIRIIKNSLSDDTPFVITGFITNKSDKVLRSPDIRIEFADEADNILETYSADLPNKMMEPKEKSRITQKIKQIPKDSSKIIIDIGNYLEFFVR